MLGEDGDGEDEGEAEEDGEANAGVAAGADGVDGVVAAGGVDEAAVGAQQLRLVGLKGEPALGAVGQRAVAVVGVVPVVEGGGVEVDAAEDGVGLVVAAGEGEQVAGVEDVELDDHCASRRGSAVVSGGRLSSSPERGCRAPSKGLAAPDVVQPRRLQPRRRNSAFSRTVMPMLVFTSGPRSTSPNQIGRWQGRGPQWGGLRDKEAVKREKIWKKRKRCDVGTNWIGTHGVRRTTDAEPAANRQWRSLRSTVRSTVRVTVPIGSSPHGPSSKFQAGCGNYPLERCVRPSAVRARTSYEVLRTCHRDRHRRLRHGGEKPPSFDAL